MGFPPEIAAIIRSMKSDMQGLFQLAQDGVLRSFNGEGKVIDYRQFSNDQVMAFLKTNDHGGKIKYEEWVNVNGRTVVDEKALWEPDELKPRQFQKGR